MKARSENGTEMPLFRGVPQKIRLVSDYFRFGPPPEPDDEVRQHIIINADGRIRFSGYSNGCRCRRPHKLRGWCRKMDTAATAKLLNSIADCFSSDFLCEFVTDCGFWQLDITNTEGEVFGYTGSLCADPQTDGISLSFLLRDLLDMSDLYAFDGAHCEDRLERLRIDLRHSTQPHGRREYLLLDRASGMLEYAQHCGEKCLALQRLQPEYAVKLLLDDIYRRELLDVMSGDAADSAADTAEYAAYTLSAEFRCREPYRISGSYDKAALPQQWGRLVQAVQQLMLCHGFGAVFDSSLYGRRRRRPGDLIYCSVELGHSGKSYYYIADEDDISIGEIVLVPVGKDDLPHQAEVVDVEYFAAAEVPFPLERTKHIIRKCSAEETEDFLLDI